MKICVFGAASAHIDKIYIDKVEALGELMAKRGHSLVFGAGGTGLMGAAARGVKRGGGFIHGVVPSFFKNDGVEQLFDDCDKITYTQTMRERKAIMEDDADAFIITPGGVGTFEELYEVVTLKQLNRHDKAIAFLDVDGYYTQLEAFMHTACERKFITPSCLNLYKIFDTPEDVLDYLESYVPTPVPFKRTKLGE
ncbi:MAG: TIGR00730 family Rossman fold protein [Clostridia bacterium]|nr:TIGR00730 family Rossman fold protein [Clostridia bacterium]